MSEHLDVASLIKIQTPARLRLIIDPEEETAGRKGISTLILPRDHAFL